MRSIQVKSLPCTQLRWARSVGWFRPGPSTFTCFGVSFRREPRISSSQTQLYAFRPENCIPILRSSIRLVLCTMYMGIKYTMCLKYASLLLPVAFFWMLLDGDCSILVERDKAFRMTTTTAHALLVAISCLRDGGVSREVLNRPSHASKIGLPWLGALHI